MTGRPSGTRWISGRTIGLRSALSCDSEADAAQYISCITVYIYSLVYPASAAGDPRIFPIEVSGAGFR